MAPNQRTVVTKLIAVAHGWKEGRRVQRGGRDGGHRPCGTREAGWPKDNGKVYTCPPGRALLRQRSPTARAPAEGGKSQLAGPTFRHHRRRKGGNQFGSGCLRGSPFGGKECVHVQMENSVPTSRKTRSIDSSKRRCVDQNTPSEQRGPPGSRRCWEGKRQMEHQDGDGQKGETLSTPENPHRRSTGITRNGATKASTPKTY